MKEEARIIRAEYYIIREGRCSDKMLAATCVDIRHSSVPRRTLLSILCLTARNRKPK